METEAEEEADARVEPCFLTRFSELSVHDVYEVARLVGAEVEKLIDAHGRHSVRGLVPRVLKVLELLESFAARNDAHAQREEELLRTFEVLQRKRQRGGPDQEVQQKEHKEQQEKQEQQQWRRRCEELQLQVQQLQEDREDLQMRLKGNNAQEDRVQRQEREVMLKLKDVVDKQRDELRAKVQQIGTISKEVEALQEQLERFMKMNAELRHKQKVLQAQLQSAVERKADMEADLKEKSKEVERMHHLRDANAANANSLSSPSQRSRDPGKTTAASPEKKDPDQPCFTKKEVRDILFERNELKTNLFLVQEELNYYQREILSEERCPGFLLEAVRSTIKKRRKLIKAKMLGISASQCSSSDEEEKTSEVPRSEVDNPVAKPAESRIQNFFGFLSRSASNRSPTHMTSSASTWEILDDSEAGDQVDQHAAASS
ncbi:unnamed protein product [Ophioblennius macclurei]